AARAGHAGMAAVGRRRRLRRSEGARPAADRARPARRLHHRGVRGARIRLSEAERMKLTGALGDFDRTRPLLDGRVRVAGFEVEWQTGELESLFSRAFERAELDITELSFSNFLIATAKGGSPYIALPVFPTRSFRHHALFIRGDRGIRSPRDLEGRGVGLREYTNTASLVLR